MGRKGFPGIGGSDREDLLKGLFIGGQGSKSFREQTLTQELGTLTQVLQLAEKHESGMAAISTDQPVSKPKVRFTDQGKGHKKRPEAKNRMVGRRKNPRNQAPTCWTWKKIWGKFISSSKQRRWPGVRKGPAKCLFILEKKGWIFQLEEKECVPLAWQVGPVHYV